MRRCEWIVRPPAKRRNRCLPWASTDSTTRPPRRSGQRSERWRAWGARISSGTRPSSTGRIRLAAWWIVSPSGIADDRRGSVSRAPSGAERQRPARGAEAGLTEQRLARRAEHRLAVDALELEFADPPAAHGVGERR